MKIGILTLFYKNYNYGGCLQAYALCKYLNDCGQDAKQISYDIFQGQHPRMYKLKKQLKRDGGKPKTLARLAVNGVRVALLRRKTKPIAGELSKRRENFDAFADKLIPHTPEYNEENLSESGKIFDKYFVGSDQVWNPDYLRASNCFFFDFVEEGRDCCSYAASVSRDKIEDPELVHSLLKKFKHISVREPSAVKLLQPLCDSEVEAVIDPTMLLDSDAWEKITSPRVEQEPYIFCYFLGDNEKHRDYARKVKQMTGLKVVDIPFGQNSFKQCDANFADESYTSAGPSEFLSLIKNAELVLTDSFHACVFSVLFKTKFFVLKRFADSEKASMNSRISDLLGAFKLTDRLVGDDELPPKDIISREIDYSFAYVHLEQERKRAKEFVLKCLND